MFELKYSVKVSVSSKVTEEEFTKGVIAIETNDPMIVCEAAVVMNNADYNIYLLQSNKLMGVYLMGLQSGKFLKDYGIK